MRKISVIIPTYNNENDIERCIDSILSQTYKNFEIILVDDCSTDNTFQKIKFLYSEYHNIKLLKNNKNRKAAYTRNRAIKHATGNYIAIQDADDYSEVNRFEKQVEFLDKNQQFHFVGSNSSSFDDKGIWKKSNTDQIPIFEDFGSKTPFVHASIMFRAEVLHSMGGYRVAKETERGQDYDLLFRLYEQGYRGYNLQEYLYFYQETLETIRKRSLGKRIMAVRMKLRYFPWSEMNVKEKIRIVKTIIISFIPSPLMYKLLKYKSKKSLNNDRG